MIGTRATIGSGAYERAIRARRPDAEVLSRPCPLFVPLAEEGWTDNEIALQVAESYLEPFAGRGRHAGAGLHPLPAAPRRHRRGHGAGGATGRLGRIDGGRGPPPAASGRRAGLRRTTGAASTTFTSPTCPGRSRRSPSDFSAAPAAAGAGQHRGRVTRDAKGEIDKAMTRHDGRTDDALRPVEMTRTTCKNPLGSVLINMGRHQVLCAASVEERVPQFLKGSGEGWVTGEYCMIPAATDPQAARDQPGPALRPDDGDPAADRPRAARRRRSQGARRAHGLGRLRGAAGGRRHAHRLHHRRLRRACAWRCPVAKKKQERPARPVADRHGRRRSRSASSRAGRCSTWTTSRIRPPRWT